MKIYMVGGCVRDELLGIKSRDKDFVVFDATEEEFLKRFKKAKKVGKKIPVYMVGRHEYTISEYSDIYQDLLSRDLTINAIAKDKKGKLYGHDISFRDLSNRVLRAISHENFVKDPLRVIRAARFYAQFPDFSVDEELKVIMTEIGGNKKLMSKIAKERVAQEVIKALSSQKPSNFFSLIIETKATAHWFEELDLLKSKKRWLEEMDFFSRTKETVWMMLCYGFYENLDDSGNYKKYFLSMSKKIGMPNLYLDVGKNFLDFFPYTFDFFSQDMEIIRKTLTTLSKKNMLHMFFQVVERITNKRYLPKVEFIAKKILSIKLPEEFRGLGRKSGEILRKMQVQEIEKCLKSL